DMGRQLARLQEIRHVAAPWQREAIDSITPMAATVATETRAAIEHLNDAAKPLWMPVYVDRLHAISEHADRVRDAVNLHLEMADIEQKLDELRDRAGMLGS